MAGGDRRRLGPRTVSDVQCAQSEWRFGSRLRSQRHGQRGGTGISPDRRALETVQRSGVEGPAPAPALYGVAVFTALATTVLVCGMLLNPWAAYAALGGCALLMTLVTYDQFNGNANEWYVRVGWIPAVANDARYDPDYLANTNLLTIGAALAITLLCVLSFVYPWTTYVAICGSVLMLVSMFAGPRTRYHDDYVNLTGVSIVYDRLRLRSGWLWDDVSNVRINDNDAREYLAKIRKDEWDVARRVPPDLDYRLN